MRAPNALRVFREVLHSTLSRHRNECSRIDCWRCSWKRCAAVAQVQDSLIRFRNLGSHGSESSTESTRCRLLSEAKFESGAAIGIVTAGANEGTAVGRGRMATRAAPSGSEHHDDAPADLAILTRDALDPRDVIDGNAVHVLPRRSGRTSGRGGSPAYVVTAALRKPQSAAAACCGR